MRIGSQIPETRDMERQLDLCAQASLDHLELGPFVLDHRDGRQSQRLFDSCADRGLRVRSVHGPFGREVDLSSSKEKKRRGAVQQQREVLEKMVLGDVEILVIHAGERLGDDSIGRRLDALRQSVVELLPLAETAHITLALENMPPGYVGGDIPALLELVRGLNNPWVGVCFDTGHAFLGSSLQREFETIGEYVVTFHIHDNDGTRDLHLQPPYGMIPWEGFLSWVDKSPYSGPLTLECFPWGRRAPEFMLQEVAWLFEGKLVRTDNPPGGIVRCRRCGHYYYQLGEAQVCACSARVGAEPGTTSAAVEEMYWEPQGEPSE